MLFYASNSSHLLLVIPPIPCFALEYHLIVPTRCLLGRKTVRHGSDFYSCHDIRRHRDNGRSWYVFPRDVLFSMHSANLLIAYAVYFDYKRRNDPEFRKALKRESRRQARIAKEEAEIQGKQQREEIKSAVQEAIEEGFPTDIEEKEAFFMQQIAQGEALAGDGNLQRFIRPLQH